MLLIEFRECFWATVKAFLSKTIFWLKISKRKSQTAGLWPTTTRSAQSELRWNAVCKCTKWSALTDWQKSLETILNLLEFWKRGSRKLQLFRLESVGPKSEFVDLISTEITRLQKKKIVGKMRRSRERKGGRNEKKSSVRALSFLIVLTQLWAVTWEHIKQKCGSIDNTS